MDDNARALNGVLDELAAIDHVLSQAISDNRPLSIDTMHDLRRSARWGRAELVKVRGALTPS